LENNAFMCIFTVNCFIFLTSELLHNALPDPVARLKEGTRMTTREGNSKSYERILKGMKGRGVYIIV